MNIEESIIEFKKMIERDKDTLRYWKSDTFGHYDEPIKKLEKDVLISETLLTAYEKEKGERERIGKLYYEANENCIKYEKELEKEKEKNESLIKERATEIVYVDKNFVRKDKIKPIQIIDLDGKIHNVYKIEEE